MKRIHNIYYFTLACVISLLLYSFSGIAQGQKKLVKGWLVETGYFSNTQPYAKAGNGDKILIVIEELSFDHKPPEGFLLKLFVKQYENFFDEYTVYRIGRKPNLPDGYLLDNMADDYGFLIHGEFKSAVAVTGTSTGGQIALCLAHKYQS